MRWAYCRRLIEFQRISGAGTKKARLNRDGLFEAGAGERVRTVDLNLGKVALYQLSYTRDEAYIVVSELQVSRQFQPDLQKNRGF